MLPLVLVKGAQKYVFIMKTANPLPEISEDSDVQGLNHHQNRFATAHGVFFLF